MPLEPIVVVVDRDLEELLPTFLAQRHADQAVFAIALPARDFAAIRRAAHGMAGAGASYGFDALSTLGQQIVDAAHAADAEKLAALFDQFDDYMARLNVKYL